MGMQLSGSLELTGSFTTSGAIVAQTLVVQTITSSITQMTGSNIFGSSLTNRQQFTGSFSVTGSTTTFAGNVGINTTPSYRLHLSGGNEVGSRFIVAGTYAPIQFSGDNATTLGGINAYSGNVVIGGGTSTGVNSSLSISTSTGAATFNSNLVSITGNGLTEFKINNSTSEWEFYMPSGSTDLRLYRGSDKVTFLANGNVGIGTSNPSAAKLHIAGDWDYNTTNNVQLQIQGATNSNQILRLGYSTTGDFGYITALVSGTAYKPLVLQNGAGGNVLIGDITQSGISAKLFVRQTADTDWSGVSIKNSTAAEYIGGMWLDSSGILTFAQSYTAGGGSFQPLAFRTTNIERMRITANGEVLMNTTSTLTAGWLCIAVASNNYNAIVLKDTGTTYSSANYYQVFTNSSNTIAGTISHNTATTVGFNTSSDYRLKEDFRDFSGLAVLANLKFYDFKWKEDNVRMYGVKAHEVDPHIPLAVSGVKDAVDEEGNIVAQGVDYSKIVPVIGKALQEAITKIEQLEARVKELENK